MRLQEFRSYVQRLSNDIYRQARPNFGTGGASITCCLLPHSIVSPTSDPSNSQKTRLCALSEHMGKFRSTGCRVCVRRRVKCDETRPHCQKCSRAGVECLGFPPPFQFVDETKETQERLTTPESKQLPGELQLWRPGLSPKSNAASVNSIRIGKQLNDSPQNVYFCFLVRQFFATGRFQDVSGNQTWMTACVSDEKAYPTATLAIRSLAAGYFGRRNSQKTIIDEGSRLYGRALLALCEGLQDPARSLSYDVLAATMTLSLYEYVAFTTRQGWVQHSQGVAKMIEMRGPKAFLEYPDRAILEMNRPVLIMQALAARRRTFLEDKEWINAAWPDPTIHRPSIVRLYDIFCHVPGLTEDVLRCQTDRKVSENFISKTQRKADHIIEDLRALSEHMRTDGYHYTREIPAGLGAPFDTALEYDTLLAAAAQTSFDAIMIQALEFQHRSRHLEWEKVSDHEGYKDIPEIRQCAVRICRSVEYLIQPQWKHSGAFCILFPARLAFFALPKPEAIWLAGILQVIADTSGFELARNILTNISVNDMSLGALKTSDYV